MLRKMAFQSACGFLCLSLLFSYLNLVFAAVLKGSTLRPTDPNPFWESSNGTFVLGFLPSTQSSSSYIFSIAYSATPIWVPTETVLDRAAALQFTDDGNLRVLNGSGFAVWQSNTANLGITSAILDDSGNLALKNDSSFTLWQSFEHPTDTVLQSQNFTRSMVLRSGPYSFSLASSGNLTLTWNNWTQYWNRGLNSSIVSNRSLVSPSLMLQPVGLLYLYDSSLPSEVNLAYSSDYGDSGDFIRFLRLDSDGNLRAYSAERDSNSPTVQWSAVSDQCEVFGWCGNMGICTYNASSPVCKCPSQNFEFSDPNDPRQGCKRKQEIEECPGNSTMLQLDHTEFLTYPPDTSTQVYFAGTTACSSNCLMDETCVASTSLADGTGMCYFKFSGFVSGYQSPSIPSTSFVKVCSPAIPNDSPANGIPDITKSKLEAWLVALVVVATIGALVIAELGLWWWFCRNNTKFGGLSAQYALLEYASGAPVQFSYKDLHRSTKGFKEKLGAGGFGAVYRGVLTTKTVVAVKQLEGIEQGAKQFRMEVAIISSTHHLNLVRLIGFCSEGRHRLLVYEFMKNGSLDYFLFSFNSARKGLNWESRFSIALGTARGITYLHEECRDCIVHCDIKPENILLDENFNARVSDFGLAKLINPKDHRQRTLTSVRGTRGYLAPEWLANLPITSKSDVYSYGMVLLEIVSGRRNFDVSEDTGGKKFSLWAYDEFDKGNFGSILDPRLADQEVDLDELGRAVQVSFWCIQEQPSQRPTMGKVVQMLEGIMVIEKPPAPKATESSLGSTSASASGSISALSTFAASAPVPSSNSSAQVLGLSSLSGRNFENSSSLRGTG
ncbi:G-type lectin S-receptor-like serine/threonine-protein kinase At1g34300 isoform X1 [Aristolochia californica]|uniref:G-type lectin S-receptor-like serine/threonine-protein kinase At1g34300 isoform X1 n=1 Tax=Aristolochia californica TaxID=171875 RepID=UPI0035D5C052